MKITREELDCFPKEAHMLIAKKGVEYNAKIEDKDILYLGTVQNHNCDTEYDLGTFVRIKHIHGNTKEYNLGDSDET